MKLRLKKEFPNPTNIMNRMGITRKIIAITMRGEDELEIEFEGEPEVSQKDIELVKQYFKQNPHWEVAKIEKGVKK